MCLAKHGPALSPTPRMFIKYFKIVNKLSLKPELPWGQGWGRGAQRSLRGHLACPSWWEGSPVSPGRPVRARPVVLLHDPVRPGANQAQSHFRTGVSPILAFSVLSQQHLTAGRQSAKGP